MRQADLALLLGVGEGLVRHVEAGRRAPTLAVLQALLPLVAHLPVGPDAAPVAAAPPAPVSGLPPGTPAPDAAELDFRRRVCLQQAARARAQLAAIEQQARVAERWAQALPALLAAAPADPSADPEAAADRAAWLADWLRRRARPLPAATVTRWHLLRARAAALEMEAAALAAPVVLPG